MPSINTIETIHLVHEAQYLMTQIPKDQRAEMQSRIDAVVSIAAIYLRVPNPEITPEKNIVIEGLKTHMKHIKESAWQTR